MKIYQSSFFGFLWQASLQKSHKILSFPPILLRRTSILFIAVLADPPLYLLPGGDFFISVYFLGGSAISPNTGSCPLSGGEEGVGLITLRKLLLSYSCNEEKKNHPIQLQVKRVRKKTSERQHLH